MRIYLFSDNDADNDTQPCFICVLFFCDKGKISYHAIYLAATVVSVCYYQITKRFIMKILLLITALFFTGCSSTQGISFFSFTNADVQSLLRQELPKLSENVSVMGLPVQFNVNDLSVNIGPDNRDVVALGVDSSAEINAFAFKYPVRLALQIEGSPFYDSEKKAIFLRNIKLIGTNVEAGGFKGNLDVLNNEAMNVINSFLAVNPVYKLNMDDPTIALLSRVPLNMQVVEGAIQLVPRL